MTKEHWHFAVLGVGVGSCKGRYLWLQHRNGKYIWGDREGACRFLNPDAADVAAYDAFAEEVERQSPEAPLFEPYVVEDNGDPLEEILRQVESLKS